MMSAVRNKNTSPELIVRKAAHRSGLRFRLHDGRLPGRPDLVLRKRMMVIFVNGCFWHRHAGCKRTTTPTSNIEFWMKKFESNVSRDERNYAALRALGWAVVVIWECEAKSIDAAADIIGSRLNLPSHLEGVSFL